MAAAREVGVKRSSIGAAAALLVLGTGASQAQDAERGRMMAERWCAECHVVGPDGAGGDAGPAFETVANREGGQADIIVAWLADPHPPMPNMSLTMAEIRDLAAYIMSLRN